MPFDGTGHERNAEVLDKMDQVLHLLSDERRWCKRELETDDGRRCIVGALIAVDAVMVLKKPIRLAIEQVIGEYYLKIEAFNDHPNTTHAVVMAVLQQARENIACSRETAPRVNHAHVVRFWDIFR
jgi:hypothetical protein